MTAQATTQRDLSGHVLDGRYDLLRKIGEGAMGSVYAARPHAGGSEVAIKILRPDLAKQDQFAARFEREAQASSRLQHPNVVRSLEYGEMPDGGAFMVMQLMRGKDLVQVLEAEQQIPWQRVCKIGAEVAEALVAAHASGVIHRDLKLSNVMLEPQPDRSLRAMVLDFGLASCYGADPDQQKLTQAGFVVGTPGYVAPELLAGGDYDERADIYALGVVLWECITGDRLWTAESPMHTLLRQLKEKPRPLPHNTEDCAPEPLRKYIYRMLSPEADRRPPSAEDVRDTLLAYFEGRIPANAAATSGSMRRPAGSSARMRRVASTSSSRHRRVPTGRPGDSGSRRRASASGSRAKTSASGSRARATSGARTRASTSNAGSRSANATSGSRSQTPSRSSSQRKLGSDLQQKSVTASATAEEDFDDQATRMYQSVAVHVDENEPLKPNRRTVSRRHAQPRKRPPPALNERMQREREARPAFSLPEPPVQSSNLRTLSFAALGAVGALLIVLVILGVL